MKLEAYDIEVGNWGIEPMPCENGSFIFNTKEIQILAERDESVKVIWNKDNQKDSGMVKYNCPKCGKNFVKESFPNFCEECGQRIKL